MTERKPSRPRIMINVTADELEYFKNEARLEKISLARYTRGLLISSEETRISTALGQLQEAGINVILENQEGEQISAMPAALLRILLLSDPALIDHFIRKPQ